MSYAPVDIVSETIREWMMIYRGRCFCVCVASPTESVMIASKPRYPRYLVSLGPEGVGGA